MAIPLTVAWELVRLYLHNRRQPPYWKPWKPVSGDGKSHSTNFCDRSIIMQTAVFFTVFDGVNIYTKYRIVNTFIDVIKSFGDLRV